MRYGNAAQAAEIAAEAVAFRTLRQHHAAALGAAREFLPEQQAQAATAKGAAASLADAIAYALGESPRPKPEPDTGRPAAGPGQLTRREQEVARLVAQGQTNSQIAATLIISARTVDAHVQHIMAKLGVDSRAQIAAWSATRSPAPATPQAPASGERRWPPDHTGRFPARGPAGG